MRPYEEKYINECYREMQEEHDACGIGLVVNIDGKKEYRTLNDALSIVEKLEHRAGKDATGEVGDGVGILVQVSHKFFEKAAKESGIEVKDEERQQCEVWTRVMGYHRPVSYFNVGKKGEHAERVHFSEKLTCESMESCCK